VPRVGELVLLAAPSCCGKTRFLEALLDGQLGNFPGSIGISFPISSYLIKTPKREAPSQISSSIQRMILHYTIPAIPFTEGRLRRIEDDPRLDIVKDADKVTAVTLLASGTVLQSRLQIRKRRSHKLFLKSVSRYFSVQKKYAKLQRIYSRSESVAAMYDSWFSYIEELSNLDKAWLVTAEDQYVIYEPNEWPRIRNTLFPASTVALQG
jgi:hypothetical protein